MFKIALLLLFLPIIIANDQTFLTFEDYFQFGKNEYTLKNWPDCIAFMKRAIDDFKQYQDDVVSCRQKCQRIVKEPSENEKISKWHQTSELALCLLRCRRDRFGDSRPELKNMNIYYDLSERKPYQYIHICYWFNGELGMAVQSAYTFLVANPTDVDIISSLEFYMKQTDFDETMLIDMERKDYETRFINGVEAYDQQDWTRCILEFEISLEKTMKEEEKCRFLCQDKIDWSAINDNNPEIDVVIASMRSSIVHCEHNCLNKLSWINGHNVGHLLAAHFEYLHFCQFNLLRGTEASQSVANYLLFDDSPLMRRNKLTYLKLYGKSELFQPSDKYLKIYKQRELEKRYLNFIDKRFQLIQNELLPEQADDHNPLRAEVTFQDDFDYSRIENILKNNECKLLRSFLPSKQSQQFLIEFEQRIKTLWPKAKYNSISCGKESREAECPRPIVLSIEKEDCGEWLGKWFTGCVIIYCDNLNI